MTTPFAVNLLDFGADPTGAAYSDAAFAAARAALAAQQPGPAAAYQPLGGRIQIPPGKYRFAAPLRPGLGVVVEGASGSGWYGGTWLLFDSDVPGLILDRYNSGGPGAADWSVVRDLCLLGSGTSPTAHGVQLYCRAKLENLFVRNFGGHGVSIDTMQQPNSAADLNNNNWRLDYLRIDQCGGDGVYVAGGNSNAGLATEVDCSANKGWGIRDDCFLNNTWTGCHVADNLLGAYCQVGNAGSVFSGCYSEGGQPPSDLQSPNALVLGGCHGAGFTATTRAFILMPTYEGARLNRPLKWIMPTPAGTTVYATVGVPGLAPIPLAFGSSDDPAGALAYSLQYSTARKAWDWLYASSRQLFEFGPDYPSFPVGYRNGQGGFGRVVKAGDGPPTSGAWQAGDRVEALHPAAGGWLGWVCVQTGTPGAWRTYGPIAA